jgi:chitinase
MNYRNTRLKVVVIAILFLFAQCIHAQTNKKAVIAYFSGNDEQLNDFDANKMTHIIYCFGHLEGNQIRLAKPGDSSVLKKMTSMKKRNPALKVLLSLGGWGGCKPCSDVFNTAEGRKEFAQSVKEINNRFSVDGIDLDWEYPVVEGFPKHTYRPEDKDNFTALLRELRTTLGDKQIITFAAGGFQQYLDKAIDWDKAAPLVDYINLMTYDLVNGNSTVTGHHTPLYSSAQTVESTDNCVQWLIKKGVDPAKLIIGAAFYARTWEKVAATNNGLYNSGKFKSYITYNVFPEKLSQASGFVYRWDDTTKAPFAYNAKLKLFATFDDKRSIALKTKYVIDQHLGGIMFWELSADKAKGGLLDTIIETLEGDVKK